MMGLISWVWTRVKGFSLKAWAWWLELPRLWAWVVAGAAVFVVVALVVGAGKWVWSAIAGIGGVGAAGYARRAMAGGQAATAASLEAESLRGQAEAAGARDKAQDEADESEARGELASSPGDGTNFARQALSDALGPEDSP